MPLTSCTHLNLTAVCRKGQLKEALHILLTTYNPPEDYYKYLQLLQACSIQNALPQGKKIHSFIAHRPFISATCTAFYNKLIYMYAKCGSLVDARKVFDHMIIRNIISWNTIILAYRRHGFPREAVTLFHRMQQTGLKPHKFTLTSVIPACTKMGDLEQGVNIHESIKDREMLSDVASALVDVYAKCGSVTKARELFDEMPRRNVFSWTSMVAGYACNGFFEKALEIFKHMQLAGVKPNFTTFASILPACTKMGALKQGTEIHQSIEEAGFLSDVVVATALVDMYGKCGSIDKARELFDRMPQRDVISRNAMIAGYAQNGFVDEAIETFKPMQLEGIDIHQSIRDRRILLDAVVATALVDLYAKCGSIDKARDLFDRMPKRDLVSWTAMISGYTQNGFFEEASETFKQMQVAGVKPDSRTFASILPACAKTGALEQGMDINQSIKEGVFFSDAIVVTALLDLYAKSRSINKARELFDGLPKRDVISWNAMIAGYAQNGFLRNL